MTRRRPPSLKARALGWLAQREHSAAEMRRKLLRHLASERRAAAADAPGVSAASQEACGLDPAVALGGADGAGDAESRRAPHALDGDVDADAAREVDAVLQWLLSHGYLSDERFIESRIRARVARHGERVIRMELAQHGLALSGEAQRELRATEAARAAALLRRKFPQPATDAAGRARQTRYLVARGFGQDAVRAAFRQQAEGHDPGGDTGDDSESDVG